MLRTASFAIALLLLPATGATADVSSCAQGSELAAARQRWVAARQARADPGDAGKSCRAYGNHFYEAVQARYAASLCEDSINRQRSLNMLDAEIDAFNNLIAAQCTGSCPPLFGGRCEPVRMARAAVAIPGAMLTALSTHNSCRRACNTDSCTRSRSHN